jgi:anaerobic selenocysteine-containing dehydrogenase
MDMDRTEYIISIGRSIGPNYCIASGASRAFLNAIDRGCKIVTVDPRGSPEAAKGEWVPIKPGTDQAFLLGMLNTILYEIKTIDVWSVKNRTNGPYLIGPDGDYVRDATSNKPLIWDEVENRARTFDEIPPMNSALEGTFDVNGVKATPAFQLVKDAMKDYTPEWAEKISEVPTGTIRRLAQEFIDHARIGATITIDGVTMPFRPVGIQYERGAFAHTIEGVFGDLVGKIICELVGCLEVPGGVTGNKWPGPTVIGPDEDGVVKPQGEAAASGKDWKWPTTALDARTFYPMSHTAVNLWAKGVVDPETYYLQNTTEAVASWCGNPIHSCFSVSTFEQAFAKIPFHFAMELVYNEAAMMADIVLPDQSHLEKMHWQPLQGTQPHRVSMEDIRAYRGFHFRDSSKITKPYKARSGDEVAIDIAERVGILHGKDGLIDFINQRGLPVALKENALDLNTKPTMLQISEAYLKEKFDPSLTIADVTDARGPIYMYETRGAKLHNYFYWPDNQTRHPMYMVQLLRVAKTLRENLAAAGLPGIPGWTDQDHYWAAYKAIPVWTPCPEFDAPPEYDLWALNWKTMPHPYGTGDTYGNVWIHEVMTRFNPYEYAVWMNADTVAKKGLKDGDIVVVESRYGKTQGRLKATQLIHPTAVGIPGIAGYRSNMENPIAGEGPYFNIICPFDEKDLAVDPISGGIEEGPAVRVYKA